MPDREGPRNGPPEEWWEQVQGLSNAFMDLAQEIRDLRLQTSGEADASGREYRRRSSDTQMSVWPIVNGVLVAVILGLGTWVWAMEGRVTQVESRLIPTDTREGIMAQLVQLNTQMADVLRRLDNIERRQGSP